MMASQASTERMHPGAGIAIGPILFIIAILAILAAAIAAGSGSFSAGTGTESNKTKSAALIQIGEFLKMGMDQITLEGSVLVPNVDINILNTALNNALFSPIGGGIAPPSVGMANDPLYDYWTFPRGTINGLGTGADNVIAVLPVSRGVCSEINNRSMGNAVVPPAAALGTFGNGTGELDGATTWPTATATWTRGATTTTTNGPTLTGVSTGCVNNSDVTATVTANCPSGVCTAGPTSQYFFYQVLAIQ